MDSSVDRGTRRMQGPIRAPLLWTVVDTPKVRWSAGHSGSFTWTTRLEAFTIDNSRCSSAIVRINSLRLAGVMAVPSRKN